MYFWFCAICQMQHKNLTTLDSKLSQANVTQRSSKSKHKYMHTRFYDFETAKVQKRNQSMEAFEIAKSSKQLGKIKIFKIQTLMKLCTTANGIVYIYFLMKEG